MNTTPFTPTTPLPIIFQGSPSQAVTAPYFVRVIIIITGVLIGFYASSLYWPRSLSVSWVVVLAITIPLLLSLLTRYVEVAATVYTIDTARITIKRGVAIRHIRSLELFRIQDVTFVQSWWQSAFGIATLVIETSDYFHPRLQLDGMRDAEQFRDALTRASVALRQANGFREVTVGRT